MIKSKVLCLSNPMGLGHVTRDLAVMKVLRKHLPSVEITWLTAQPVTSVLEEAVELLYPASHQMLSTSKDLTPQNLADVFKMALTSDTLDQKVKMQLDGVETTAQLILSHLNQQVQP